MTLGINRPNILQAEQRRAHRAGTSYGKVVRDISSRLDTAIVPDETGNMGCGLSIIPAATSTIAISGTLYAVYLGRATGGKKLDTISIVTTVVGSGTAAGVVGFATSDAGPDFTAKVLTVRAVKSIDTTQPIGRVSNLTGVAAGAATEAAKLAFVPSSGVHIWAFILTTNATTQATQWGLSGDVGAGTIQVLTGQTVAAAVVGKVYTMTQPSASVSAFQMPQLYVV